MPSQFVDNCTPFAAEAMFLADEDGRPVVVPIVKATYRIERGGALALAESQMPVCLAGAYVGKPGESSYQYEPEIALTKAATDVVLVGSAYGRNGTGREVEVTFRVGPVDKTVRVFGDRTWVKRLGGGIGATAPNPFDRIPLVYERAYGGWDRSHADPERHGYEPRNPVGTGYRQRHARFEEGVRLPNIEDPRKLIKSWGELAPPAGFGFIGPHWQPRVAYAGTYDSAWMNTRMPLLPRDFDRRFFNAASVGLVAPGFLTGGEVVVVHNATPDGHLDCRLPQVPPPQCTVGVDGRPDHRFFTRLDTVIVNTDECLLMLLWRGDAPIIGDPSNVRTVHVDVEGVPVISH